MTGDITRWLLIAAVVRREEFTASICSAARCDWPPEDDLIAIKRRVCVRDSCWSTVMFELHCTEFVFTFKHVDAPAGVMTSQLVQSQSGARMKHWGWTFQ